MKEMIKTPRESSISSLRSSINRERKKYIITIPDKTIPVNTRKMHEDFCDRLYTPCSIPVHKNIGGV